MSVTCVVHHGEVDKTDTIELPGGHVCTRCYEWMESLLDDDDDDDTIEITFIDNDDELVEETGEDSDNWAF